MNETLRYAIRLTAVTLGIAILLYVIRLYTGTNVIHPQFGLILVFLYLLSLANSAFVNYGIRRNRNNFSLFFFPAMIFRFFASIIFILVLVLTKTESVLMFVLDFFALYLLYQVFEITSLMTNLRSHLENRGNEDN